MTPRDLSRCCLRLTRGDRRSIASLWEVSDDGTNSLMNLFYEQLQQDKRSSTEALAQAQRAMIQEAKMINRSDRRRSLKVVQSPDKRQPPFSHPYYWAPFILIGNGMQKMGSSGLDNLNVSGDAPILLLNIVQTFLGWLPGVLHAFWVITKKS
jgi:hypothetical protein